MSCWVATPVAADYLGLSLDQLTEQIAHGQWPAKIEFGFNLIDIAPKGPKAVTPARPNAAASNFPAFKPAGQPPLPLIHDAADDSDPEAFTDWRPARAATSLTRRPPRARN